VQVKTDRCVIRSDVELPFRRVSPDVVVGGGVAKKKENRAGTIANRRGVLSPLVGGLRRKVTTAS
jgi:hypothetical protein